MGNYCPQVINETARSAYRSRKAPHIWRPKAAAPPAPPPGPGLGTLLVTHRVFVATLHAPSDHPSAAASRATSETSFIYPAGPTAPSRWMHSTCMRRRVHTGGKAWCFPMCARRAASRVGTGTIPPLGEHYVLCAFSFNFCVNIVRWFSTCLLLACSRVIQLPLWVGNEEVACGHVTEPPVVFASFKAGHTLNQSVSQPGNE